MCGAFGVAGADTAFAGRVPPVLAMKANPASERNLDSGHVSIILIVRLRRNAADGSVHRDDAPQHEAGGGVEIEALPGVLVDRGADHPRFMSVDRLFGYDASLVG